MTLEPGQWWTAHAQNIVPGGETESSTSSRPDHTDHVTTVWRGGWESTQTTLPLLTD